MWLMLIALSVGKVPADEVTRLPGWKGKLPSEHYSGYLNVGNLSKAPGYPIHSSLPPSLLYPRRANGARLESGGVKTACNLFLPHACNVGAVNALL